MKKNIAFVLALVAFALIGCEKNTPWEPGDPAKTKQFIFFPVPGELGVELDPEAGVTSHDFVIERQDSANALTVKLNIIENTDKVFTIPTSVSFAAGEARKIITAEFGKMEEGGTYKLAVQVDLDALNPYALVLDENDEPLVPVYEYEATLIKYVDQVGVWVDQTVGPAFAADAAAWTVNYQRADLPSGLVKLRVINPYNCMATAEDEHGIPNGFPYNEPGDFDAENTYNFMLILDPESGEVVFEDALTELGVAWGNYGPMFFYDYAGGAGTYGSYDDEANVVVFDAQDNSMLMGMGESLYAIQVNFLFYLTVDDFLKDNAASAPARLVKKTVFGAQRIR